MWLTAKKRKVGLSQPNYAPTPELVFHDKGNLEEIHISILEECRNIKTPKEMENYVLPLGAERFYPEPERIFHNTVPIEESALPEAREKASVQKGILLDFFDQRFPMNFTPIEVWKAVNHITSGTSMLLTSVRRGITDLTKEGRLIKCDYSESRKGAYGALNRVWRYNNEYMKPINPQK